MAKAVIATIGEDRPGPVNELAELVLEVKLNIEDSRMTVLGGEFAVLMSVTGATDALEALEQRLEKLAATSGLAYLFRRTVERAAADTSVCLVTVEAVDHPGIVHGIASFFSEHGINIRELETQTQPAAHTGAPVFNVRMEIEVQNTMDRTRLVDSFQQFCTDEGLEAEISEAR
jgi:glycine cleavage system transcriptional repressor